MYRDFWPAFLGSGRFSHNEKAKKEGKVFYLWGKLRQLYGKVWQRFP